MAKATGKSTSRRACVSTVGHETPASAYISKLEHELADLSNHTFVVSRWIEDIFQNCNASKSLNFPGTYVINEGQVEATLFLVYDLERRINRVQSEYFAAIEAGAISQLPERPERLA